jgi:6-pyruvoyltetrahydropterin/6-carboxytetrahydropterin synthase
MYEIAIEDTFDAAHCLPGDTGDCKRLHGHTYRVRAAFRFDTLQESGMAFDFRRAKEFLRGAIGYLDHRYINELPEFLSHVPTAEHLARFIFDRIKINGLAVYSVSVWETPTSCATYFEE